jgi:hypothetical protein
VKFQTEQTDFVLPEEGSYVFEYLGIFGEPRQWPAKDGESEGDWSMMLQFRIIDDEDYPDEPTVRDFFPMKVTSGNKTGKLYAAVLGVSSTDLPEEFDEADLVGRSFRATYTHVSKDGKTYGKVTAPLPMRKRRQQVASDDEPGF